jgi:phospholipid-translocating ATPase
MIDGMYQSVICFFLPYLLFAPATFNDPSGHNVNDNRQMGVYIANAAIIVINSYILMNTYQWDYLMLIVTVFSILLIFAWTGIYTSFTVSFQFYKAGAEVYGTLTFWALTFLTVVVCLLPRFTAKSFQKMFMPRMVDVVRDQVREGKFDYLNDKEEEDYSPKKSKPAMSDSSTEDSMMNGKSPETSRPMAERPTSGDPFRSTSASGEYDRHAENRISNPFTLPRSSEERRPDGPLRPSFDRLRQSENRGSYYERMRPSFEQSRDFTTSVGLMRVESSRAETTRELQQREDDAGR